MRTILKATAAIIGIALIAMQFIARPDRVNPVEDHRVALSSRLHVPDSVQAILDRSCNDCHSHRTVWPWYSAVAPVSWFVAHDVEEGRRHLNFSEWGTYPVKRQAAKLEMISAEVDKGDMPVRAYVLMHGQAALSEADKDMLCDWAADASDSLMGRGH